MSFELKSSLRHDGRPLSQRLSSFEVSSKYCSKTVRISMSRPLNTFPGRRISQTAHFKSSGISILYATKMARGQGLSRKVEDLKVFNDFWRRKPDESNILMDPSAQLDSSRSKMDGPKSENLIWAKKKSIISNPKPLTFRVVYFHPSDRLLS